jgi:diphthamide synthase (EF-2-diphthine--ammonia ligase)
MRRKKLILHLQIAAGVEAIIIKVAALGLGSEHLGKSLGEVANVPLN